MKILKINQHAGFKPGSSLQGYMQASYDELVKKFGEPTLKAERDGGYDKVWTEWTLEFEVEDREGDVDYIYATIYDWKEKSPEDSRSGQYRWHIGGFSWVAEDAVGTAFNDEVAYA